MLPARTIILLSVAIACGVAAAAFVAQTVAPPAKPSLPAAPPIDPKALVGVWNGLDRHAAMATLFQVEHGVRKRDASIEFKLVGGRLVGRANGEDSDAPDGVEFRNLSLADGQLAFEFDIRFSKEKGPLAVEAGRAEPKGRVRVEAKLEKDRLTGVWKMLLADGTEVFRGEWEARRAKAEEKKR